MATFEYWRSASGLPIVDSAGKRLMGGHSARLGRAQMLAREGLHVIQIELMARWSSPMILHYAKAAPLTHITEDYQALKIGKDLHARLDELACSLEALKAASGRSERLDQVELAQRAAVDLPESWRDLVNERLEEFRRELIRKPSDFVRNADTGVWHAVKDGSLNLIPAAWSAWCGWPFGLGNFTRSNVIPEFGRKCVKCCGPASGDHASSASEG